MHENGSKIYNIKNVLFLDELPMSHDYDRNSIAQTGNCAFKKGFTLFCILNMNSPEIAIVTVFFITALQWSTQKIPLAKWDGLVDGFCVVNKLALFQLGSQIDNFEISSEAGSNLEETK